MEPETKKPRVEEAATATPAPATSSSPSRFTTVYVRCSKLHRRGDLVNDFFYQHREALQMEAWYDPNRHQLYADAPLEIVLVQTSRKPFFLVEWRHPTAQERAQRKPHQGDEDGAKAENGEEEGEANERTPDVVPSSPHDAFSALSQEALETYAQRLLSLGTAASSPVVYNGEPVSISPASAGASVADAREKLHLRDLAHKKAAEEEAKQRQQQESKPKPTVTSFVPRVVRRRN